MSTRHAFSFSGHYDPENTSFGGCWPATRSPWRRGAASRRTGTATRRS
ncbi:hypothetical protein ACFQZC_27215 [Streptacidiphilus monticola]